jgi:Holliday junction DNA helicase RuvA
MIASLRGKPLVRGVNRVTIDVGGVGYDVAVPLSTISALPEDGEVFLHIQTVIRENTLELYGGSSIKREKHFSRCYWESQELVLV